MSTAAPLQKKSGNSAAAGTKAAHTQTSIFEQMMENSPLNFIRADTDLIIRYMNPASRATLAKVAHLLPIKVDDIVAAGIVSSTKTRPISAAFYPIRRTCRIGLTFAWGRRR